MSPWTARGPPALLLPPVLVRVQVLLLLLAAAPAAGKVSAGRRHPHPAHRNSHPPSWGHARSTRPGAPSWRPFLVAAGSMKVPRRAAWGREQAEMPREQVGR